MTTIARLLRQTGGASAVEFAMVLPLVILFLLGIIDAGRFMWEYNRAEKATQMGVRYAVATDLVPGQAFADYSFSVDGDLAQGAVVPNGEFDNVVCVSTGCTCTGGDICGEVAFDTVAFGNIVTRMAAMYPRITSGNVQIEYRNVGLGYAGDPNGPDVAPLVTVSLIPGANGFTFQPITTMLFGFEFNMPDFRASLTLEDGAGAVAN